MARSVASPAARWSGWQLRNRAQSRSGLQVTTRCGRTWRIPVHVVSQRLGHASPVVTLTVYAHVVPGSQREAADLFARLVAGAAS
jgi:integrase